ncbi:MAG: ribonuclease HII [Candidatus Theseobacter exili]|nr:ribonuclease HII [Candidatus Theseobacter exili]
MEDESIRLRRISALEQSFRSNGYQYVAGVDEAGRGPLAGPVVAAAVIYPEGLLTEGVRDSKTLSPNKRNKLYQQISENNRILKGIASCSEKEIDSLNILKATHKAMTEAILCLPVKPGIVLVDGLPIPDFPFEYKAIVKGDLHCFSIAAASIIAKVTRDRIMEEYDNKWPQYGFAIHKGYPTSHHIKMLQEFGPCPIHRHSFGPVKKVLDKYS